jgi:hypothetical protein
VRPDWAATPIPDPPRRPASRLYPIGQRRVDKPGGYGIHSDALGCILQGCRLSETRHAVLTSDVSYHTCSAD